jgi:hypothetical protein
VRRERAGFELHKQGQEALHQAQDRGLQRPRQPIPRFLGDDRRAHLVERDREAVGQVVCGGGAHGRN